MNEDQGNVDFFIGIIILLLIICIWRMIYCNIYIKLLIMIIIYVGIFYISKVFFKHLIQKFKLINEKKVIFIMSILFLLIPLCMNVVYEIHKNNYLHGIPVGNKIYFKINYDIKEIYQKGSVGKDWEYNHFFNGTEFNSEDIIEVEFDKPFSITSQFVEHDKINDIGETTSRKYIYSLNENYKNDIVITQDVHVKEKGGRRYAGSYIDFRVIYILKRVLPKNISFWDIFLYISNGIDKFICVLFIDLEIVIIICVLIVFIKNRNKE